MNEQPSMEQEPSLEEQKQIIDGMRSRMGEMIVINEDLYLDEIYPKDIVPYGQNLRKKYPDVDKYRACYPLFGKTGEFAEGCCDKFDFLGEDSAAAFFKKISEKFDSLNSHKK